MFSVSTGAGGVQRWCDYKAIRTVITFNAMENPLGHMVRRHRQMQPRVKKEASSGTTRPASNYRALLPSTSKAPRRSQLPPFTSSKTKQVLRR